jgi:signal transduction histidine kinase
MLGLLQDPALPVDSLADHIRAILDPLDELGIAGQVMEVGQPRPLPPSLPPVIHRIVQESITNVIKHAGASEVVVQLIYKPDMFCIELSDKGGSLAGSRLEGRVTPAAGFGISGMRVRVEEAGGIFIAGRQDDGFTVRATFPTSNPLHTDSIGIDSAQPPSESSPAR